MLPELVAEFFGTFILIVFGNGIVAMVVLFSHGVPGEIVNGGYTNITLGWGLAVTMGVYVAGRISGAHINPAVTLAVAFFRGFPWRKVIPYWIAQTAGAFLAAAVVYWNIRRGCSRHFRHFLKSSPRDSWIRRSARLSCYF